MSCMQCIFYLCLIQRRPSRLSWDSCLDFLHAFFAKPMQPMGLSLPEYYRDGMTKYHVDRVDRLITTSTVARWLWRANHCSKQPRWPRTCRVAVLERAVLSLGTDRSSACVATPTSRTFHYRDDRTFEQDVGADCSNSYIAHYLSIISCMVQSSAVPFCERSRVRAVIMQSTRHTPTGNNMRYEQRVIKCPVFLLSHSEVMNGSLLVACLWMRVVW